MAILYLRSTDGSDASDGSTWDLAKATLAGAFAAASAGDTIYVSDNHAETQASTMTLTSPGTAAAPCRVLCVDDSAEPPTAMATTATITTTGATDMIFVGFAICDGITFSAATTGARLMTFVSAAPWYWKFVNCKLKLGTATSGARISVGSSGTGADDNLLELVNTVLEFGNAGHAVSARCALKWSGTASAVAGTAPTILFVADSTNPAVVNIRGVDLSAMGSGTSLVDVSSARGHLYRFENCKLHADGAITTGTNPGQGGSEVRVTNCDGADTNDRYLKHDYQGDITHEATIILTGGASNGTRQTSLKMVSSANAKFYSPLVSDPIVIWNETTGSSITATIEVVTDNVTLTDAEAWIEVEYLGTSGFPLSLFARDRATNILSTPANQTSSSVTWTTTGLGIPIKQKLSKDFTPQEKGPIQIRVHLAKASTTMYFDFDPDDVLA